MACGNGGGGQHPRWACSVPAGWRGDPTRSDHPLSPLAKVSPPGDHSVIGVDDAHLLNQLPPIPWRVGVAKLETGSAVLRRAGAEAWIVSMVNVDGLE